MAFLPGIFSRGGNPAPQTPQAPQQQAPQQQAPAQPGPAQVQLQQPVNPDANPATMQNSPAAPAAQGPIPAKLDDFANLFKPQAADPNAPKQPTLQDPLLTPINPDAFKQQIAQANFAAGIPQETLQKAISGDAQALMDAINHASREAFAAATQLSHGLVEHGSRTAAERALGLVDSKVRNSLLRSQNPTNEVLQNPAVAPVFNAVKTQLAQANPQMSPEAVTQAAEAYFSQMAEAFTAPQRQAEATKNAPKGTDFSYLLS